ncbi:MAG: hypothetical protein JWO02_2940, partial [Solirubrobacterales bacterium]|nr:hypothetical protein [Solirubrobacterales bacterium]
MILKSTWMRVGAVSAVCALAGAGAGIAGSMAAPNKAKKRGTTTSASGTTTTKERPEGRGGPGRGFGRGPVVHAEAVVLNKAGKAYITQTLDNGLVKSVSGDELVITEGTTAVPYKDVTVKIASDATIQRNGKTAKLSDLKAGDQVHVAASSDGTSVFAADDTFRPRGRPGGPGGPGGPGRRGHGGPP